MIHASRSYGPPTQPPGFDRPQIKVADLCCAKYMFTQYYPRPSQTWAKHWFVLRGTSLILYRDTGAEDLNVTDGLIDLNGAQRVEECETEKNYGFQITVREDRKIQSE